MPDLSPKRGAADEVRQRLLGLGPHELTDAELLALALGPVTATRIEEARALLGRFDGLRGVGRSHAAELMQVRGIGRSRACALAALLELARRLERACRVRGEPVRCSQDAFLLLRSRLALLEREVFLVLALDAKHRVLALRQAAQGSTCSVEVHPREVFAPLLREGAAGAIVAHNHPSGDPEPSSEDRALTRRLKQAGEIMGIPLLDHLVVGGGAYVSLADRGLLI